MDADSASTVQYRFGQTRSEAAEKPVRQQHQNIGKTMAWLYLKLPGGTLKIKPRDHLRQVERNGDVPLLDLGPVIFSWWSNRRLAGEMDAREETNKVLQR